MNAAEILQIVFAAVVAIATVTYVLLTRAILAENRRIRRAQTEPRVLVYLEPKYLNWIDVVVHNVGPGAAYDVRLLPSRDFRILDDAKLSEIGFFQRPIPVLGPGQRFQTLFAILSDLKDDGAGLDMGVEYCDTLGSKLSESYPLDLAVFQGMRPGGDPPLKVLSDGVSRLSQTLDRHYGRIDISSDLGPKLALISQSLDEIAVSMKMNRITGQK
jgi:hypothetical protein